MDHGLVCRPMKCWAALTHHRGLAQAASHQEKKVWLNKKLERRAARESISVAQRVMASEEETVRRATARRSTKLLPSSLLEILSDRIHRGQWDAALKVFHLLRAQRWYEPYTGTYIRLFEMLGKCSRPHEARSLYQTMLSDGVPPTTQTFTALISAYTRSNLLKSGFEILESMKVTPHCSPDVFTYSLLIKACCDCGQLSRVGALLSEMTSRGVSPNVVTYNIIIDAYGRAGMMLELEKLVKGMVSGAGGACCTPDNWTRNAVVRAFGNNGMVDKMEEWYERLTLAGEAPDTNTLHSLLSAYGKAEMFDKMSCVIKYIHKYHYEIDAVTYNILLNAYGRSGRLVQMSRTFTSMKCAGVKPDSVTYCTLFNYYGRYGLQTKLPRLVEQMMVHKVRPDTALFNSLLDAYRRCGDVASMEKYLVMMKELGCKPDHPTYTIMILAYRSKGMSSEAEVMAIEQEKLRQEESINRAFVSSIRP